MGLLKPYTNVSCDTAASVARQYSLTRRNYGTEAVSVISTLRENRYRPDLSPDVAQLQNNTSYIKPFRANALVQNYPGMSRPKKKMLRPYFEYSMRKGKCDVVKLGTTIEPRIVAYLLA